MKTFLLIASVAFFGFANAYSLGGIIFAGTDTTMAECADVYLWDAATGGTYLYTSCLDANFEFHFTSLAADTYWIDVDSAYIHKDDYPVPPYTRYNTFNSNPERIRVIVAGDVYRVIRRTEMQWIGILDRKPTDCICPNG